MSTRPGKLVAIVTPQHRFPLTPEEEISLRHLREYLGKVDRYIIGTQKLPKEMSDFELRRFPAKFFGSAVGYNRLLTTEQFYRAFADYKYILIYQLDCLVFSNALEEWCRKGWDYVGAPWLNDPNDPTKGFAGVGDGGLSLRNVASALAVLTSKQLLEDPMVRGSKTRLFRSTPKLKSAATTAKTVLHQYGFHNNVRWLIREQIKHPKFHEDEFWAFDAPKVVTEFRIPSPHRALDFSFEIAPDYCLKENSGRMPFGCHGWAKYDRKFWEPFLLK